MTTTLAERKNSDQRQDMVNAGGAELGTAAEVVRREADGVETRLVEAVRTPFDTLTANSSRTYYQTPSSRAPVTLEDLEAALSPLRRTAVLPTPEVSTDLNQAHRTLEAFFPRIPTTRPAAKWRAKVSGHGLDDMLAQAPRLNGGGATGATLTRGTGLDDPAGALSSSRNTARPPAEVVRQVGEIRLLQDYPAIGEVVAVEIGPSTHSDVCHKCGVHHGEKLYPCAMCRRCGCSHCVPADMRVATYKCPADHEPWAVRDYTEHIKEVEDQWALFEVKRVTVSGRLWGHLLMRAGPAPGTAHEDVVSGTLHFFARDPDDEKERWLDKYLIDTKERHLDMKSVLEMAAPPGRDRPERYELAPAHAIRLRAFAQAALAEESDSDGSDDD